MKKSSNHPRSIMGPGVTPGCVFCDIVAGKIPCDKVYEDKNVLAFLSINPEKPGHTLVIPKKHFKNIKDCPKESLYEVISAAQEIAKRYTCTKIVINTEKPLQEVFHLHVHVIPY